MRLLLLLCSCLLPGLGLAASVQDRYAESCAHCHDSGAEGAPRSGDRAAWASRLQQGDNALLQHVKNGMRAMPPRGLCNDCSDAEYRALIQFMSK